MAISIVPRAPSRSIPPSDTAAAPSTAPLSQRPPLVATKPPSTSIRWGMPNQEKPLDNGLRGVLPVVGSYEDLGAGLALERLRATPGAISGDDMSRTLLDAVRDRDGRGATAEYRDLRRFADANWHRMTPEARHAFRQYEQLALESQANGQPGIPASKMDALEQSWARGEGRKLPLPHYRDASVRAALEPLEEKNGPVTAGDFLAAFSGALDRDGQLFGRELDELARFADHNWERMTPGARAAFRTYEKAGLQARARGDKGASFDQLSSLLGQMLSSATLADDTRLYQPLRG